MLIRQFQSNGRPALSPDGKKLATIADFDILVWDTATGEQLLRLPGHSGPINVVTFSPDSRMIGSGSVDRTARLWDVATGKEIRRFVGHKAGLENVIFSPDGRYILTGGDDSTARLWYVNLDDVINDLCARLPRDLTDKERAEYGIIDSGPSCPLQQP